MDARTDEENEREVRAEACKSELQLVLWRHGFVLARKDDQGLVLRDRAHLTNDQVTLWELGLDQTTVEHE